MELKFNNNISNHLSWYNNKKLLLSSYFFEGFIGYDFDLSSSFYDEIKESLLNKIDFEFFPKKVKCYYFIMLETENSSIDNYYKIWKKIGRKHNIKFLNIIYEKKITINDKKYFVSLVDFDKKYLNKIIPLQIDYLYNSCCLIDFSIDNGLKDIDIDFLSNSFILSINNQELYINLFTKYCAKNIMVLRIGSGGEDMRFDFVFKKKLSLVTTQ